MFAVFWRLYSFFWVISRPLNFKCRRFGTLSAIFIGGLSSLWQVSTLYGPSSERNTVESEVYVICACPYQAQFVLTYFVITHLCHTHHDRVICRNPPVHIFTGDRKPWQILNRQTLKHVTLWRRNKKQLFLWMQHFINRCKVCFYEAAFYQQV